MLAKVLITGASGFVGGAFAHHAASRGLPIRVAVRGGNETIGQLFEPAHIPEIDGDTDWTAALEGITAVTHCAARAHVLKEHCRDPLSEYRRVNVAASINLAHQAARAGVRRFIFLSSIGVNGPETHAKPFTAQDVAAPESPYAISKYEAETELQAISRNTGLELVIIRPPLVYGPGAKGNLQTMIRWIESGIPLPLGAIRNKRSLVGLDNLVDLMLLCVEHRAAAHQTFLVSDGEDISTTELIQRIAHALGKHAKLLPIESNLLRTIAKLAGKADIAQRLIGSLQIDASKTRSLLSWSPPLSVDEGLRRIVRSQHR